MSSSMNQLTVSATSDKVKSAPNSPPLLKPIKSSGSGLAIKYHTNPRTMRANSAEPERPVVNLSSSMTLPPSPKVSSSSRLMRRAPTIDTSDIKREEYEGCTRVNQYKVLNIIGHGSYGIVRKATDDTDAVYAMKILNKKKLIRKGGFAGRVRPGMKPRSTPWDNIEREIAILKKLDHPNVVHLFEVLDDPREDELLLVFEYIHKGPVIDKLPMEETFSENVSRDYFVDVILGLEYLHSQHVIHRDIKPQNLLVDDSGSIKIADFGVSEQIERTEANLSRWAGTPAFLAPETLTSSSSFRGQGVDIWAAGVTLFCFVFGNVPWSPPSKPELYEMIQKDEIPIPPDKPVSMELQDILMKLLTKEPECRVTISELREHPWILQTSRTIPTRQENCVEEISVSDEDIQKAIQPFYTPLYILMMIKQMARRRSLRNPKYSYCESSPHPSPATSPISPPSSQSPFEVETVAEPTTDLSQQGKRDRFAQSRNTPAIRIEVDK